MSKYSLYLGQAGQNYIMSQFLKRGYNVAVPQVDVGDDIFVIEDEAGLFHRIQVKTAKAIKTKNGFSSRFKVALPQLITEITPELYYTFVTDFDYNWQPTLIISRKELFDLYDAHAIGSKIDKQILLYFQFKLNPKEVICSKISFTFYLNNWSDFPPILD